MFRYYMTPETRQAVIAESNRLIAERAALNATRRHADTRDAEGRGDADPSAHDTDAGQTDFSDSAFARLVSDLQLTSLRTPSAASPAPAR